MERSTHAEAEDLQWVLIQRALYYYNPVFNGATGLISQ